MLMKMYFSKVVLMVCKLKFNHQGLGMPKLPIEQHQKQSLWALMETRKRINQKVNYTRARSQRAILQLTRTGSCLIRHMRRRHGEREARYHAAIKRPDI